MDRPIPRTGELYRHFKNKMYQIVTIATHSETGEKLVIYQALYGDYSCCARPLEMFMSEVDKVKYPDVTAKYRFEKVSLDELETIHIERTQTKDKQYDEPTQMKRVVEVSSEDIVRDEEATKIKQIDNEEERVNPDLLRFLDADTYAEKRNLLVSMKDRITDDLIDSIAASLDITVNDGDIEERYMSLFNCVVTMEKFEVTNRLR